MKKLIIYPYKMTSESAKALATTLGAKQVLPNGRYRPKPNHIIIGWGNSQYPTWERETIPFPQRGFYGVRFLNHPLHVGYATNKLTTFKIFSGVDIPDSWSPYDLVPTPEWTTELEIAEAWVEQGHKVLCRTTITGHSGQGIILASTIEELVEAPLYTKYTKCKQEFRIHIAGNQVIDFVMKKKRLDITPEQEQFFSPYIHSHTYGWIFAREGVILPEKVKEAALGAIRALGLNFGAVDIGYKVNEDKAFVYEVNTAPGVTGTTLTNYSNYFKSLL